MKKTILMASVVFALVFAGERVAQSTSIDMVRPLSGPDKVLDCVVEKLRTTKLSTEQIKKICQGDAKPDSAARPKKEPKKVPISDNDSFSDTEIYWQGKRYVRDTRSITDSGNGVKQVVDEIQRPDSRNVCANNPDLCGSAGAEKLR